jgi:hypothetical protein
MEGAEEAQSGQGKGWSSQPTAVRGLSRRLRPGFRSRPPSAPFGVPGSTSPGAAQARYQPSARASPFGTLTAPLRHPLMRHKAMSKPNLTQGCAHGTPSAPHAVSCNPCTQAKSVGFVTFSVGCQHESSCLLAHLHWDSKGGRGGHDLSKGRSTRAGGVHHRRERAFPRLTAPSPACKRLV